MHFGKSNHAFRRVEPCKLRSPTMQVAERNHASLRVHGCARASPSIGFFFNFLTWILAQRAISTPISRARVRTHARSYCTQDMNRKRIQGLLAGKPALDGETPTLTVARWQIRVPPNERTVSYSWRSPRLCESTTPPARAGDGRGEVSRGHSSRPRRRRIRTPGVWGQILRGSRTRGSACCTGGRTCTAFSRRRGCGRRPRASRTPS